MLPLNSVSCVWPISLFHIFDSSVKCSNLLFFSLFFLLFLCLFCLWVPDRFFFLFTVFFLFFFFVVVFPPFPSKYPRSLLFSCRLHRKWEFYRRVWISVCVCSSCPLAFLFSPLPFSLRVWGKVCFWRGDQRVICINIKSFWWVCLFCLQGATSLLKRSIMGVRFVGSLWEMKQRPRIALALYGCQPGPGRRR